MWKDIGGHTKEELDAADRVYRRWARERLKSGKLAGFIVESAKGEPLSSGCVWLMEAQPRPRWKGTTFGYLLSMYTEPEHRIKGYGTRIVREAIRWAREQGCAGMSLHASRMGFAVYEREGFKRTHEMRLVLDGRPKVPRRKR